MGTSLSRQNAAVEEADVSLNHPYKYPPKTGNPNRCQSNKITKTSFFLFSFDVHTLKRKNVYLYFEKKKNKNGCSAWTMDSKY